MDDNLTYNISKNLEILVNETYNIKKILNNILKEQIDEGDKGEYLRKIDTATAKLTPIDIKGILGHCVKGYSLKNDGANTIYIAHNIAGSGIDDGIDVGDARFESVYSKEEFKINYNRKKIRNIYFKTTAGNSAYRLTLVW